MKQMKMLLDEMHQYVQAFNRNNQILKDNWQDKKSEHFSDTCITIVNGALVRSTCRLSSRCKWVLTVLWSSSNQWSKN